MNPAERAFGAAYALNESHAHDLRALFVADESDEFIATVTPPFLLSVAMSLECASAIHAGIGDDQPGCQQRRRPRPDVSWLLIEWCEGDAFDAKGLTMFSMILFARQSRFR